MSIHRWDWKKSSDVVVGDFIVHESDNLRAVLETKIHTKGREVTGIELRGQDWYVIYHDPDYMVKVLVKNE